MNSYHSIYQKMRRATSVPRSVEYWRGVRAALAHRLAGIPICLPYEPGCTEYDAWRAGLDAGAAEAAARAAGGEVAA